jgi:ribosomal protein S18 acetylase RimI-like enzyme
MKIRCMTEADLDFAISLTSKEGWSSTRTDFEELLRFDSHGCFIGEEKNKRVGMVCAISYGHFGNIGNLIVPEICRGRKLGSILMEYAMSYLLGKGASVIFLDGVQAAVSLYERLEFRKICKSLRLSGHVIGKASDHVRMMESSDINEVLAIDIQHFKADRSFFLQSCQENNPRLCVVLEIDNIITGYILGSPRKSSVRIGPWVMHRHLDKAEELLRAFVEKTENQSVQLGVLETSVQAIHLMQKLGFTETSYSWRMGKGDLENVEFSKGMYAIHSPARG